MKNITLFSQIISKLDSLLYSKRVKEKETDKHQKGFKIWTHLVAMLVCQFAKPSPQLPRRLRLKNDRQHLVPRIHCPRLIFYQE